MQRYKVQPRDRPGFYELFAMSITHAAHLTRMWPGVVVTRWPL